MIKSRYGNITIDGNPDSPGYSFQPDKSNFWDYIEDDIKPLVKVFIDTGIKTFSSCQGHCYGDYNGSGSRSITAHVKYCTNDIIDSIVQKVLEPYIGQILSFYKTEYISCFGYTSEITFYETENRTKLMSQFEIIEKVLAKAFKENENVIQESIKQYAFESRKNFSKLNILFDLNHLFKPGDEPVGFFEQIEQLRSDPELIADYIGTKDFRIVS